jgi:hypothetical protein
MGTPTIFRLVYGSPRAARTRGIFDSPSAQDVTYLEPEAMKDVVKYLKGMQNTISKHISNFWVNAKMAGEGKSYPMYLKLRIGTNVFGDNLTQLNQDLRSISSNVAVWKSTLQKADVVTLGWWKNTHRNFHLPWITNWANNIAVQLSAGTCKNTLPGLDKDIFKGRDPIELGFQWKAVQDGYNKDSQVKAGRKQYYAVHVLAEKRISHWPMSLSMHSLSAHLCSATQPWSFVWPHCTNKKMVLWKN